MAPPEKDGHRRKSINPFSRNTTGGESNERKKLSKRSSKLALTPPQENGATLEAPPRTDMRPRGMSKSMPRPGSVFGSLGRRSVVSVDEDDFDGQPPSSPEEEKGSFLSGNKSVLHHGEVQTSTSMFRKKKEYLVLTETHLHRFKSRSRASEAFGNVFPARSQGNNRHPSTGSLHDVQSMDSHSSREMDNGIPLRHIVTAYKLEGQRLFHITEVVYLDEETNISGSMQLMLQDHREADLWHTSIRGAAQKARLMSQDCFSQRVIQFLVNVVEDADDYSPEHFKMFKVVRRPGNGKPPRSSSDDLSKMGLSCAYCVIGVNKLHLISVPEVPDGNKRTSWGILSLVGMSLQHSDDVFELIFRMPTQSPYVLDLAASAAPEIVILVFQAITYVRPQYLDHTFAFKGPPRLFEDYPRGAVAAEAEEYGCFDRTLIAYCAAYGMRPENICYTVDWRVEDAPEFRLLPAANGQDYSLLELLAVLRSLRYNNSFHSISFKGVSLQCLHSEHDTHGYDHFAWTTREGKAIHKYIPNRREESLLFQEIRALAVKSRRLRRMDFSNTLPNRRPKDNEDDAFPDPGSEITKALLPLCQHKFTTVDWVILSGIELGETDFEILLTSTAVDKHNYEKPNLCSIRAIEVSRCGLNDRGLQLILSCIERLHRTIQCIDVSHNPCRINDLEQFQTTMLRCSQIRKLNLSRVARPVTDLPLLTAQVLLSWKLEELVLDGIIINDSSLHAIAEYLASEQSNCLRILSLNQCHLTGTQVARLMRSMCSLQKEQARDLHLHVSTNKVEKGNSDIVACIEEGQTPTQLTMRMVEYQKEDHFRQLLAALRTNTTIRRLDISKASLPYDASADTCEALQKVFADNTALEEFDISGEHAHLEVARFGIGLNQALGGLKSNKTLKVLTIEYQNLGLEGANTLSAVLESNATLTHINCANNGINLQGFTVLTNAIAKNFSVVHLPMMKADWEEAVRRMKAQIMDTKVLSSGAPNVKHLARRTLKGMTHTQTKGKGVATVQDVEQAVAHLHSIWMVQSERLLGFLYRNQQIANGVVGYTADAQAEENLRPATALSDRGIIEYALSNTTPKLELSNPVDWQGNTTSLESTSHHFGDSGDELTDADTLGGISPRNYGPMSPISQVSTTATSTTNTASDLLSASMRASLDLAAALDRVLAQNGVDATGKNGVAGEAHQHPNPTLLITREAEVEVERAQMAKVGSGEIFDMDP